MGRIVLVTGGARSGKSRYAQERAAASSAPAQGRVLFIATAEASDDEMRSRIARHKQDRPPGWHLRETPLEPAQVLATIEDVYDVVLLDCLTLFVSNVLQSLNDRTDDEIERRMDQEIIDLCRAARLMSGTVIFVTNEVGMGLHPLTHLGRLFADLAGRANQQVAAQADEVILMVCGIPLKIKG
jgi:adenosylcobinamide kinase/adenosylcobinamide-phosphate guanylyltransferase